MINNPKKGDLVFFIDGRRSLTGTIARILGENEILYIKRMSSNEYFFMEPHECFTSFNDLCESYLSVIREFNKQIKKEFIVDSD